MTVLFSEYLIEKKLLSMEQVLEIFIEQLEIIPSSAELIYEFNLLPKNDLLKILMKQQIEGLDFQASAKSLGLWNSEVSDSVKKKLKEIYKPFTEILVQKEYLTLDNLSSAIISFTEQNIQESNPIKPVIEPIHKLNKEMLFEYLDCFENVISINIKSFLAKIKNSEITQNNFRNEINNVKSEFIALQAAANFVNAKYSEKVSILVSNYIEKIVSLNNEFNIDKTKEIIEMAFNILEGYFQSLKLNEIEDIKGLNPNDVYNELKNIVEKS